jgi:hypothetical protein
LLFNALPTEGALEAARTQAPVQYCYTLYFLALRISLAHAPNPGKMSALPYSTTNLHTKGKVHMQRIIRFALLFVVLGIGFVSTAPTKGIEARTTKELGVTPTALAACPELQCIPEMYFDKKLCRCVYRP